VPIQKICSSQKEITTLKELDKLLLKKGRLQEIFFKAFNIMSLKKYMSYLFMIYEVSKLITFIHNQSSSSQSLYKDAKMLLSESAKASHFLITQDSLRFIPSIAKIGILLRKYIKSASKL
jgi:hypothetical protein